MIDSRITLMLGICLVVIVILLITACARRGDTQRGKGTPQTQVAPSPSERFRVLAAERNDYSLLVGIPLSAPTRWAKVTKMNDGTLTVDGHGTLQVSEVQAFIVAYPNGQMIDCNAGGLPLPKGITGLFPSVDADVDTLQLADIEPGEKYIQVEYGPSLLRPHDRSHYSTTLTNISGERIRVNRFAGYAKTSKGWKLFTVTKQFYSAEEFRQWYGLGNNEWIVPGQSASDPNNYGSPPVLWAYYCECESGKRFVAGSVLE